jgi:hypothetical protein
MNEHEFEELIRLTFLDRAAAPAPMALRSVVAAIPEAHPRFRRTGMVRGWSQPRMHRWVPVGVAVAAAMVGVIIGIGLLARPSTNVGHPSPSPTPVSTPASRAASWQATGSMIAARSSFTATLLKDGRVLVTGGDGIHPLASTELYDPRTGKWTATGKLITGRRGNSATLLPDGKVLVAGGIFYGPGFGPVASAEVYDPATGRWTATGSMKAKRWDQLAVALLDGRVLVMGGGASSAELFDPTTGRWTTTGKPTGPRGWPNSSDTATLLTSGDVLITSYEFPAQLYHPRTGTWTAAAPMLKPVSYTTATLLSDGRVLVAAGWGTGGVVISSAEIYDPQRDTWTVTGSLSRNYEPNASMLLPDGTVLVVAGLSAERYDPRTGQWHVAVGMPNKVPPSHMAAVQLADGRILIAGGEGSKGAYIYDPGTNQ